MRRALALLLCSVLGLASCSRDTPARPLAVPAATPASPATPPVSLPLATPASPPASPPATLQAGRAVLVQGTGRTSGVPGFGRNAFPALSGVYLYQRAAAPAAGKPDTIAVWYTRIALLVAPPWSAASCPGLPAEYRAFMAPAAGGGTALWLLAGSGYSLVASLPAEVTEPCRFLAVFAERFSFFLRYSERPEDISFPATLELGR